MQEIEFLVQGSVAEPYHVKFVSDQSVLNAFCTCAAGQNGQYCKHRLRILSGDATNVISENVPQVDLIRTWLAGTVLEKMILEFAEAERDLEIVQRRLATAKKNVAKAMRD